MSNNRKAYYKGFFKTYIVEIIESDEFLPRHKSKNEYVIKFPNGRIKVVTGDYLVLATNKTEDI